MAEYLIQGETLTSIADEIRLKTGLADQLSTEQMVIDIAASPSPLGDVPVYVQTEAERVAKAVAAVQTDSTVSFIALADLHTLSTNETAMTGLTHAMQGAKIIQGRVPIDFTAVLGDFVYGAGSDTLEQHMENHMAARRLVSILHPDVEFPGNHDQGYSAAFISAEELYRYVGRFSTALTKPDTDPDRGYGYFDLTDKLMRIICLNTSDQKDMTASGKPEYISAAQYQWLASTLDMTGKEGWSVLILTHHPVHWKVVTDGLLPLLDAYVSGTSGSVTVNGTTVAFDFAGKNAAKLVGNVHGHTHNLISGKAGDSQFLRIGTPNAYFYRNNEYGNASDYPDEEFRAAYGENTTYSKTAGTAADTAFCVYTVDLDREIVYAHCYGAGYDRVLSFADIVYHLVTSNLTNITTDNDAPVVEDGASYTAALTVADGYELQTVTVTMGGVDVTSDVYADGIITIPAVTGAVVITATATKIVTYTNLILQAEALDSTELYNGTGYKDDTYVSGDSPYEGTASGIVATGWIPYDPTNTLPLYIKGATMDLTSSRTRMHAYSDKSKVLLQTSATNTTAANNLTTYFEVTSLGTNYCKLTPVLNSSGVPQIAAITQYVAKYIRFSLVGTGAELAITLDELIV